MTDNAMPERQDMEIVFITHPLAKCDALFERRVSLCGPVVLNVEYDGKNISMGTMRMVSRANF